MELHDILPLAINILMAIAIGGLFLSILFIDKIRLNGKEKGGRNIAITLAVSLTATLLFSIAANFFLSENFSGSLSNELVPAGAKIFAVLSLLAFLPGLLVLGKIGLLLIRRKRHA